MMDKRKLSAWGLIALGVVLLGMQLEILTPSRSTVVILISAFIGVMLLYKGLNHAKHKGILGGSFFLLTALTLLLMKTEIITPDDQLRAALIIINLAAANFIYYLFQREYVSNIIAGFIFLIVGVVIFINYYDVLPLWLTVDLLQRYWPVVLIVIGAILLSKATLNNKKKTTDLTQNTD